MVGHIVPPVSHYHVCNIGGVGNCYGLDNCLTCGHNLSNYYHHGHVHLCLNNYCNNYYCNSLLGGTELSAVALVLTLIIILLASSPLLGTSIRFLAAALLTPVGFVTSVIASIVFIIIIVVCLFIMFLFFWGRGRWLRLLLRYVCLYLISFLLYLL